MKEPRFVITGSGRSGTGYVSALLRKCGINCGHEEWWGLDTSIRVKQLDGDASWIATFDTDYTGHRFAQVRNPWESIQSLASSGFAHSEYNALHTQNVELSGDPMLDAIRVWTTYTRHAVETSEYWWNLEELDETVIETICSIAGIGATGVGHALGTTSKRTNKRTRKDFSWPNGPEMKKATTLAKQLGFYT